MKLIGRLLKNRNFILLLAMALGLSLGKPLATLTVPLILPFLAIVMTLSAINVTSRELTTLKNIPYSVGISLLLNYLVMGGIILLLAWLLIEDNDLWIGFVVLAAVPPAVGVVPFSYILGGNTLFSLIGMTATYLSALIIMPAVMTLFLGTGYFDPLRVIIILGELVLLPIVLSRILLAIKLVERIKPWQGTITNWSFFIVIFTIVGLNREAFFSEYNTLIRVIVIAVIISFILGFTLDLSSRAVRINRETSISMILMGTTKNYGLASGILLTLFGERAALPASVCAVFGVLHAVWLGFRFRKKT
jgi:BASS family bile acid:Na+ symporter